MIRSGIEGREINAIVDPSRSPADYAGTALSFLEQVFEQYDTIFSSVRYAAAAIDLKRATTGPLAYAKELILGTQGVPGGRWDVLINLLDPIDIEGLDQGTGDPEKSDKVLNDLLKACFDARDIRCARAVIMRWRIANMAEENWSILTQMFVKPLFSDELLSWIMREVENTVGIMEILTELVWWDAGDDVITAFDRCIQIMGELKLAEYQDLQANAILAGNGETRLIDAIESYIAPLSPFNDVPPWIIPYTVGGRANLLITDQELLRILPDPDESVEVETDDVGELSVLATRGHYGYLRDPDLSGVDHVKERVQRLFEGMNVQDREQLMQFKGLELFREVMTSLSLVFSVLGPVNAEAGEDLTEDHECSRFGGCRMFTCVCTELADPMTDEIRDHDEVEWFRGACDWCRKRIRKRIYAFRRPLPEGMWEGCFCSPQCSLGAVINRQEECLSCMSCEEDIDQCDIQRRKFSSGLYWGVYCSDACATRNQSEEELIVPLLVERVLDQLMDIKIFERRETGPVVIPDITMNYRTGIIAPDEPDSESPIDEEAEKYGPGGLEFFAARGV